MFLFILNCAHSRKELILIQPAFEKNKYNLQIFAFYIATIFIFVFCALMCICSMHMKNINRRGLNLFRSFVIYLLLCQLQSHILF